MSFYTSDQVSRTLGVKTDSLERIEREHLYRPARSRSGVKMYSLKDVAALFLWLNTPIPGRQSGSKIRLKRRGGDISNDQNI